MLVLVGLGNPGKRYEATRHNIGFQFLDELAGSSTSWQSKFDCEYLKLRLEGEDLMLVKPQSYMNLSGEALRKLVDFFKIPASDVLIVHDELDLKPGALQLRTGGSAAGNNGIKSIYKHLNTQEIMRLRVGIGHPRDFDNRAVDSWVLSVPRPEEKELLQDALFKAQGMLKVLINEGLESAKAHLKKQS